MNTRLPLLTFVLTLAAACSGDKQSAPTSGLPERFYLAAPPSGAVDVAAARAAAQDGQPVVVRGVVGGTEQPFVAGLAAFTLVDPALKSCVGDGMGCATPWDYCCVDPKKVMESSVTVELREGANPLPHTAQGFHGLDPLTTVIVQGTAERDERGNVTVVASGLHPLKP
jgi:hypothetical protein